MDLLKTQQQHVGLA